MDRSNEGERDAVVEALREYREGLRAEYERHDSAMSASREVLSALLERGKTAGLDRMSMSEAASESWSYTTRLTVVEAVAERDAELLGHRFAGAHLLAAIVWYGGSMASHALGESGIDKSALPELREQIVALRDQERGMDARALDHAAVDYACEFGDHYIGLEHLILAILDDTSLAESVLPADLRPSARTRVHEMIEKSKTH